VQKTTASTWIFLSTAEPVHHFFTLWLAGDYSRLFVKTSMRSSVLPVMPTEPLTCYLPWSCTSHSTRLLHISTNLIHPSRVTRSAMKLQRLRRGDIELLILRNVGTAPLATGRKLLTQKYFII